MVQTPLPPRYRLIEEVGQGGMAVVYRAQDETLKREVAIKVLHPHLLAEPESKARLEREARAVAKLQHDNILQIFDYSGSDSPSAYIVTEFIDGKTLKQFLASHKLPAPEIGVLIAIEVGNALSHAHSLGILHRDVKPENVMVRKDGIVKLMDFGVAQIVDFERMTVTGQLLGSPAYMAPELIEGKPLDFRTDVFSVGIMLYQLTTGSLPFTGRNPHEVLKRIAEGRFTDPRSLNARVSDGLCRIITRALARRPEDRYPTIAAALDDLRQFAADAGLQKGHDELKAFFVDPNGYAKDLSSRMAAALVEKGRQQRTAGRTAPALELWNRALAIEPGNAEVTLALRRLEGSRRFRRAALVVGATLAFGAFSVAAIRMGGKEGDAPAINTGLMTAPPPAAVTAPKPPAVTTAATLSDELPPSPAPAPAARTMPVAPRQRLASQKLANPRHDRGATTTTMPPAPATAPSGGAAAAIIAPVPEAPKQARRFQLGPTPRKVAVWLDGAKQFDYDLDHQTIDIPWDGKHLLEFRSPYCQTSQFLLGPGLPLQSPDQIISQLQWKDAFLVVKTKPARPGAKIIITEPDGAGKPNRLQLTPDPGVKMPIRFDPSDERQKTLEVVVSVGDKTIINRVTVTAGQTETLSVPVEP